MKHKPTIVYIITKLELGGAQKICLSLFFELKKQSFKTLLISGTQGYLADTVKNHPDFIPLPILKRELSYSTIITDIKAFFFLIKILKQLRKSHPKLIVHTHSTKAGILGRWAAWLAGVSKRIHTVHGFAFHDFQPWYIWWPVYLIELVTSLITTQFVCVSSADIKQGVTLFPFFSTKHTLIRAAVETHAFVPAQKTDALKQNNNFIFGSVSCFKPQKNLFDLLKAFELVHQILPSARLEIVGDGTLRPHIEQWIKEKKLEANILLHGWQRHVAPIMTQWSCFVLTSLWEGLPCAIIEARLLKLPVISYDTGGIHDVIVDGKNGYLVPQHDWRTFAQRMIGLAQHKKEQKKLSNSTDNFNDFTMKSMIQEHTKTYINL